MSTLLRSLPRVRPVGFGTGLLSRIDAAFRLWGEREQLDRLEPHMLRDLGVTKDDVRRERARPVWDAPGWWTPRP